VKVYLIGCHGAGKSTLARYISKQHSLPFLTETVRKVLSERELNIDAIRHDLDVIDSFQQEVFDRQMAEEKKYTEFVSDRSALDALAYSSQHTRILPKLLRSAELVSYISDLKKPDVRIFFVRPLRVAIKPDGVRETLTYDGIIQIDTIVKFLLEMYELPHFIINTDSMQERVKLIDSVILAK